MSFHFPASVTTEQLPLPTIPIRKEINVVPDLDSNLTYDILEDLSKEALIQTVLGQQRQKYQLQDDLVISHDLIMKQKHEIAVMKNPNQTDVKMPANQENPTVTIDMGTLMKMKNNIRSYRMVLKYLAVRTFVRNWRVRSEFRRIRQRLHSLLAIVRIMLLCHQMPVSSLTKILAQVTETGVDNGDFSARIDAQYTQMTQAGESVGMNLGCGGSEDSAETLNFGHTLGIDGLGAKSNNMNARSQGNSSLDTVSLHTERNGTSVVNYDNNHMNMTNSNDPESNILNSLENNDLNSSVSSMLHVINDWLHANQHKHLRHPSNTPIRYHSNATTSSASSSTNINNTNTRGDTPSYVAPDFTHFHGSHDNPADDTNVSMGQLFGGNNVGRGMNPSSASSSAHTPVNPSDELLITPDMERAFGSRVNTNPGLVSLYNNTSYKQSTNTTPSRAHHKADRAGEYVDGVNDDVIARRAAGGIMAQNFNNIFYANIEQITMGVHVAKSVLLSLAANTIRTRQMLLTFFSRNAVLSSQHSQLSSQMNGLVSKLTETRDRLAFVSQHSVSLGNLSFNQPAKPSNDHEYTAQELGIEIKNDNYDLPAIKMNSQCDHNPNPHSHCGEVNIDPSRVYTTSTHAKRQQMNYDKQSKHYNRSHASQSFHKLNSPLVLDLTTRPPPPDPAELTRLFLQQQNMIKTLVGKNSELLYRLKVARQSATITQNERVGKMLELQRLSGGESTGRLHSTRGSRPNNRTETNSSRSNTNSNTRESTCTSTSTSTSTSSSSSRTKSNNVNNNNNNNNTSKDLVSRTRELGLTQSVSHLFQYTPYNNDLIQDQVASERALHYVSPVWPGLYAGGKSDDNNNNNNNRNNANVNDSRSDSVNNHNYTHDNGDLQSIFPLKPNIPVGPYECRPTLFPKDGILGGMSSRNDIKTKTLSSHEEEYFIGSHSTNQDNYTSTDGTQPYQQESSKPTPVIVPQPNHNRTKPRGNDQQHDDVADLYASFVDQKLGLNTNMNKNGLIMTLKKR